MALAAQATKISVNATKKPSGFTDSGGTNLTTSQPTYENLSLSVTKSIVEDASKSTTFDQIRTDAAVGIEKQVADLLTNDMDVAVATITYNIDWKDIKNNFTFAEDFYGDAVAVYYAIVDVYINVS